MKKRIFLFDPTCLSYRMHVYEYFINEFSKNGYELNIFYDREKAIIAQSGFNAMRYAFIPFLKLHISEQPDVSIFFVWLSYKFSLFFLLFSRFFLPVKTIVWSKGINISNINQPLKNILYYIRQHAANALILYSYFEKRYIKANLNKTFVANNTINQNVYNVSNNISDSLRKKNGINEAKVVLFVGRIQERKRIDLLINNFAKKDFKDTALLIVGSGLSNEHNDIVKKSKNIYYLGPVYDIQILSELYSLSHIFCIPGEIGLGLNEAFLFGMPVVTSYTRPTSEMKLLFRDGENGLLFEKDNQEDLAKKLNYLLSDDRIYKKFSESAVKSFEENAKIEYMLDGFLKAVKYVEAE